MSQTIKISDKAYRKLMKESIKREKEYGRRVSAAELIDEKMFER